jgi:hypothetical protein
MSKSYHILALRNISYGINFDLGGQRVEVSRSGDTGSKVSIKADDGTLLPKAGEIRTQLLLAEKKAQELRNTLSTFEVLPNTKSWNKKRAT